MSRPFRDWDDRTQALAVEKVTSGLAREERDEFVARVGADGFDALEDLERSAAALHLAGLRRLDTPPAALILRLQADARARFAGEHTAHVQSRAIEPQRSGRRLLAISGWLAAAVLLAVFVLERLPQRARDAEAARAMLVSSAPDLVRAPWVATADPLAGDVSGDVVWSRDRQEGYLRFRDLPPNDPARRQYQLWIFDKSRAEWEAKPVDGGVFDVGPGAEVVVRIDPSSRCARRPCSR
jgi:hypothetical protein